MGGNQEEHGGRGTNFMSSFRDDSLNQLQSTSKVCSYPLEAGSDSSHSALTSTSYFSTLEVPQKFSFEKNFKKSNASIAPESISPDRSLSSGSTSNSLLSFDPTFSSRVTLGGSCHIEPQGGSISHQIMPGVKFSYRPENLRSSERSSEKGRGRSASSLKRQKYLEKKRKTSSWPCGSKRSSISDDEDEDISLQPSRKVFVNEEKMAARFDNLSLSHNGMEHYHSLPITSKVANAKKVLEEIDSRLMDSDDEDAEEDIRIKSSNPNGQLLQISDPLKKALKDSKTELLPDKIVKKIANPCTALVLWQPSLTSSLTDSIRTEETSPSTETGASQMDLSDTEAKSDTQLAVVDIGSHSLNGTDSSASDDDMDL